VITAGMGIVLCPAILGAVAGGAVLGPQDQAASVIEPFSWGRWPAWT
jgi:hypothetical protein